MILDLVPPSHPALKQPCEMFDFDSPPCDPLQLALDLKETMIAKGGVGLSANQVGLPYSVFVVGDRLDPDNIRVFFNSKIVNTSDELVLMEEGCLTYPGLFVKIKRPNSCRIRYQDPNGTMDTKVYDGIPARIILHECDHMNGDVFYKHANKYHLDSAKKQKKKLDKLREANRKKLSKSINL